jgi:AAA ATPase-like protein
VLAVGEAGIGKTRLLEETSERARQRGFAVAWGRGWELGGAPSFWPWLELLRALIARALAPRAFADRLRPLLLERAPGGDVGADAFQLYDAVQSYLHAHAQLEPLALFIDDLHAVDPSSLVLAELVTRGLSGSRIALFGSHRTPSGHGGELEQGLVRLGRASHSVALAPLTREDVSSWMLDANGTADADAARLIHQASDGNPLFVSELLRLPGLAHQGTLGQLPPTLRGVIRERLGPLGKETLAVLRAAALVGRQFTSPLLAQLAQVTGAEIDAALREACEVGVLAMLAPGHYRFSHVLVAETLVLGLDPARRAALHRRAAEALERRHASDPMAPVNEIARHWLAAGVDAAPFAVIAAERAALHAMQRLAFADAADLYERTLEALALCSPPDGRREADLCVAAVEALSRCGRRERAEAACARAVELARALADGPLLARAALALGAESHLGTADSMVARLLERALTALPPGDGELRALVSARLASARQPELDPEPPMALAREAVAMARRLADPALTLRVVHAAVGALMDFAPAEERAALNAEALDLATRANDHPRALQASQRLAFDRIELGDVSGFERALIRYEAVATEVAQPRYAWVPAMFRAMRADWQGDRARADYWEGEARAIRDQSDGGGAALAPVRPLSRALLYADAALLERFVGELSARSPRGSGALWLGALLAAWRGHDAAVHAALDTLAARGLARFVGRAEPAAGSRDAVAGRAAQEPRDTAASMEASHAKGLGYLHLPEVAVELACHLREVPWANALYAELLPSAGKPLLLTTLGFSVHGAVDHALMRLSALARRWPEARSHAAAAIELCSRLGARPILARIHYDAAEHASTERDEATAEGRRADLTRAAREHLSRAQALAREIGWHELLGRCARVNSDALDALPYSTHAQAVRRTTEHIGPQLADRHGGSDRYGAAIATEGALRLIQEGEYWTVSADGALCRVQDGRGMRMLAQLVEQAGREVHVLELSGSPTGVDSSDAGEMLDTRARDAYQERLRDLRSEIDQASSFNDLGRREVLEAEAEALVRELSRGLGLGGRPRRSASAIERARVNVRRRLTLALRRIHAASPELGKLVQSGLRTGVHCLYTPHHRARS